MMWPEEAGTAVGATVVAEAAGAGVAAVAAEAAGAGVGEEPEGEALPFEGAVSGGRRAFGRRSSGCSCRYLALPFRFFLFCPPLFVAGVLALFGRVVPTVIHGSGFMRLKQQTVSHGYGSDVIPLHVVC